MTSGSERSPELVLQDFHYDLPAERIAQQPAATRDSSRLMLLSRSGDVAPSDASMGDVAEHLRGDELVVLNDTRVVPARLAGRKSTGGAVELLVLDPHRPTGDQLEVLARSSKPLRPGGRVDVGGSGFEVLERLEGGRYRMRLPEDLARGPEALLAFLDRHGEVPLPPYIDRCEGPSEVDEDRYQTVYAASAGAVAAPTAGLHFTHELLERVRRRGCEVVRVTLHVGIGTFLPVRVERISEHRMHGEDYLIPEATAQAVRAARAAGRPVLAVGTTVVRTLEGSAAASPDGLPRAETGSTRLFLTPGATFRVVDQLLTNFHLPGSTLLMLVSAFAGRERMLAAYRAAIDRGYRFYSYGDGMLIR